MRNGPSGEIHDRPTPTEARRSLKLIFSFSPKTLPASTKPNMRSVRSLPAPGNGVMSSAFKVILRGPPIVEPVTSLGPRVPWSKPRTEPRPPE